MIRPDFTSLALFLKVLDSGSPSRAAEQSNIALSAASRCVSLLEDDFGVHLLHRTATGVEPTAAGSVAVSRNMVRLI